MDQAKVMKTLSDVTAGGRYIELEDGTIVPAPAEADAGTAEQPGGGGTGAVVGATNGEPSSPPELS